MRPNYIIIHTAAFRGRNCDAELIDSWHKLRGWAGIGYHYVILNDRHDTKQDGEVEKGRPDDRTGAHTKGLNAQSIGICCVGHGDYEQFTSAQHDSLMDLLVELSVRHGLGEERIIGHKEINNLVESGLLEYEYRTSKSCPGTLIDMNAIRAEVGERLVSVDISSFEGPGEAVPMPAEVARAIEVLRQHRASFRNSRDELNEFLFHPEVLEIS